MGQATTPPPPTTDNRAAIERAMDILRNRRGHLFLTGRAGTGKTYFLDKARQELADERNLVVLAPTGVAAVKAGGRTLNSFFQFGYQAYAPTGPELNEEFGAHFKLSTESREIIRALDLLFIDEVSMVRADRLDVVDTVLRRVRGNDEAFGGVQVCLIGDTFQLPPIVKAGPQKAILNDHYDSLFFFAARCFNREDWSAVELPVVMRQRDRAFIGALNRIRVGRVTDADLQLLNSRTLARQAVTRSGLEHVLLTSTKAAVSTRNEARLRALAGQLYRFSAIKRGQFAPSDYPTVYDLEVKIGAMVMFLTNDPERRFYNGRLGMVSAIGEASITVTTEVGNPIEVTRHTWENIEYRYDRANSRLREDPVGTFTQFPLRLAYALTIHKSQGLTIDKVTVDLGRVFAEGMSYVALSRARSFAGLLLESPLTPRQIKVSAEATDFQRWVDGFGEEGPFVRARVRPRFALPEPPAEAVEATNQSGEGDSSSESILSPPSEEVPRDVAALVHRMDRLEGKLDTILTKLDKLLSSED